MVGGIWTLIFGYVLPSHVSCVAANGGDVKLSDPTNAALAKHYRQSTGSSSITAKKDGRYEYCFSNVMSTIADKIVRWGSP